MQIYVSLNYVLLVSILVSAFPPAFAAVTQDSPAPTASATVIDQFTVKPVSKIESGTELKFSLSGTPRGKATVSIDDVIKDFPLQEIHPGVYEGTYTIRQTDTIFENINATAVLESSGLVSRSRLTLALPTEARPLNARNMSPRADETVATNPVLISATFDDAGAIVIDTKTVRVLVAGNDVSRNAVITPQFFSYRTTLQPGAYVVEVRANDVAGRALRQTWSFNVATAAVPVATVLPLQITSHLNNAKVGAELIDIRGHTAADARLDVQVQALASITGFFSFNQKIFAQTVKADANGNFAIAFQPQVTVAGTRYEVTINASKADLTKEVKINLFQQK